MFVISDLLVLLKLIFDKMELDLSMVDSLDEWNNIMLDIEDCGE